MPSYPDPNFTYGVAQFRLVVPAANQRAPQPMRQQRGVWVGIPYGGNTYVKDGAFGITSWSPSGGIEVQDTSSYTTLVSLYNAETFNALRTPWGTFQAVLRAFDVVHFPGEGVYRGGCTWEWSA